MVAGVLLVPAANELCFLWPLFNTPVHCLLPSRHVGSNSARTLYCIGFHNHEIATLSLSLQEPTSQLPNSLRTLAANNNTLIEACQVTLFAHVPVRKYLLAPSVCMLKELCRLIPLRLTRATPTRP